MIFVLRPRHDILLKQKPHAGRWFPGFLNAEDLSKEHPTYFEVEADFVMVRLRILRHAPNPARVSAKVTKAI